MKHKRILGYSAIGLTLIAVGVAFIKPVSASGILFRVRATNVTAGSIVFDKSNTTKSGTTNTTLCNSRDGGSIVCKTFENDSSKSSGYLGALKGGSIIKFYNSDGVTEFTFQDLEIIRFDKVSESNSNFDFTLHALYDDGTSFNQSYTITAFSSYKLINFNTYGNVSNIWIECTSSSGQVTKLTTITITYNCSSKQQTGATVLNAPTKTTYEEGELFDPSGMIVAGVYSDESTIATNVYSYSPTGYLSTSDTEITIYCGGFITTQPIIVNALPELTGLYIDTPPNKTSYYVGDYFNTAGMIVKGTFSDDVDRVINGYTYSPSGELTTSDVSVVISYGGFSTFQTISVSENSYAGTYNYVSGSNTYTLVINNDGTGVYTFVNTSYSYNCSMHFTWVVTGDATKTITFTKDEKSGDSQMSTGSYYDLFTTSGSYNTTNSATINETTIKLYTCSTSFRTSTVKNMNKPS